MLLHIAAGGDTRAPFFSTVLFAYFALELCGFSTVLFEFEMPECSNKEAMESTEI